MNAWPNIVRALTVAVIGSMMFPAAHGQQIKVDKNNRALAVTASDSVTAIADTASIHIGYQAYGPDSQAAYASASQVSDAITKALTNAGVAEDSLESTTQSIAETQRYEVEKLPPAKRMQRKFRVQQSWTVKTNAKDAARILNAAVDAGANQSGQIDWSMADENTLDAQAAGKALLRARTIAEQMASGLGVKMGNLIYASNIAASRDDRFSLPAPAGMMMRGGSAPDTKPLSISPQKVSKSATVSAIFAIE